MLDQTECEGSRCKRDETQGTKRGEEARDRGNSFPRCLVSEGRPIDVVFTCPPRQNGNEREDSAHCPSVARAH